jgi:hypothetical protein
MGFIATLGIMIVSCFVISKLSNLKYKSKVGLACTICLGRKTLSDERYKALVIASKPGYGYFILLNGGDCYLMHEDRVEFD